ncbi:MAG: hypothetical protein ACLTSZ_00035 [Lachnospiraceae bacterium]
MLCNTIPRSKQLSKTVLALDGFAGFTPAQIKGDRGAAHPV